MENETNRGNICSQCGCHLLWDEGAYCQVCMRMVDIRMQQKCEMLNNVVAVSVTGQRKEECSTCGGDPYAQPCPDCGASGHKGNEPSPVYAEDVAKAIRKHRDGEYSDEETGTAQ